MNSVPRRDQRDIPTPRENRSSLLFPLVTLAIISAYAGIMLSTNARFTILDDESTIIAFAGHPFASTVMSFITGAGLHEHPPASDLLLHLWLSITHHSFFALRIFANIFYIGGILFTALTARRLSGDRAYWCTLVLGCVWPFAFQYGRISGWYCVCFFLIAWLTYSYVRIVEDQNGSCRFSLALSGLLLVWSNYFGVVVLCLLLFDLLVFHRDLARVHYKRILSIAGLITLGFLPLVRAFFFGVVPLAKLVAKAGDAIAEVGYSGFSIFGSTAVAPWYLPLSIPILLAVIALLVSIWFSCGRRWFVYFLICFSVLGLAGELNIKRILFLFPWLFLSMGLAAFGTESRYPKSAIVALVVVVSCGWIGIASARHAATTNLHEPWRYVAEVVARDVRRGSPVISDNFPFFFYLNYQLGLEARTAAETGGYGAYLGEDVYRSNGYTVLEPDSSLAVADKLHGRVVVVLGSALKEDVEQLNALNDALHVRCAMTGEYHAAPDPAFQWKRRFVRDAPALTYRTRVVWYECPAE